MSIRPSGLENEPSVLRSVKRPFLSEKQCRLGRVFENPASPPHHEFCPSCSTTRNLCTVKSSTSSSLKRAFLITRRPTASLPIDSTPMATTPNAAAPTASANRLAAEMALDCSVTSRDIGDLLRDNDYLRRCSAIKALISFVSSGLSAMLGIFGWGSSRKDASFSAL